MQQTVLVIEDSAAVQSLIKVRLKDEPISIHFALNGTDGLALAASVVPDLILLDVEMQGLDGFEVCRRLKNDSALMGIPVVFLSGAASSEQKIRGLELGAIDYITKPFDPAELRARVRAALRLKFMIDLLSKKAQIDALTGLWNRRYFDERLSSELSLARRAGRSLGVMLLDIDHFKKINDTLGHPAGDEVLRRVAMYLAEAVRAEDVVCRYGGEEFAILCPNLGGGGDVLAERLRMGIEQLGIKLNGKMLPFTISIGLAECENGADPDMVRHADEALYYSKQNGRNRVTLAPRAAVEVPTA
jgi:diguanylate cyclase (GGDEF)-like protein